MNTDRRKKRTRRPEPGGNESVTVLLKTVSSNDDYTADCDYAVVDLTRELARTCLDRIQLVKTLQRSHASLHEIHYWDNHARFVRWFEGLENMTDLELNEPAEQVLDEQSFCIPNGPVEIPEKAVQGTDCLYMVVGDKEVYWEAIPRHAAIRIGTGEIGRKTIEKVARGRMRRTAGDGAGRK